MKTLSTNAVERFFAFMRERESVRRKKAAGKPWPWTEDKILQTYSFTNVKREHDKTSRLLIEEFYKPNFKAPRELLLLNCAIARWFGTIEFMRALEWQYDFDALRIKRMVVSRKDEGKKVFTGAYIITPGPGGHKEDFVIDTVLAQLWQARRRLVNVEWTSWREFVEKLLELPGFGQFMAKEVVLDTMYTNFWPKGVEDRNTWTPVGPGSQRGAARVRGDDKANKLSIPETLKTCQELFATHDSYWPENYVSLELHDIQFQLCEFDKYSRVKLGQGRPRKLYQHVKQGSLI